MLLAQPGRPGAGHRLLTASGDDLTDSDDLGRKMMRQVAGAFMEYEKGRLVAKLRGARERKRKETGKYSELRGPRCAPPPSRARVGHQPNACNTGVVDRSDDNPENRTPTRQIFSAALAPCRDWRN